MPVAEVEHAWAILGLTATDADTPMLSHADVEALATWVAMRALLGEDATDGYMRVLGATVSRLAEAVSSMIRTVPPGSGSATPATSSPPRRPIRKSPGSSLAWAR